MSGSSPWRLSDQVGVELAGDFGDAIGAAGMIAAQCRTRAAETLDGGDDARIVGGDDDEIGAFGLAGAFVDMLHEILTGLPQEGVCRADAARRNERG